MKSPELDEVMREQIEFRNSFKSVQLSTLSQDMLPEASYAPFVQDDENNIYIYVSDLSRHTANLLKHSQLSALFIQNESEAKHIFARQRLTYECASQEIERESAHWHNIMERFEEKFGKFIQMLKGLEDFHLFQISPKRANYVRGFAQAYEITGDTLENIRHMNDMGHKPKNKSTDDAMNNASAEAG